MFSDSDILNLGKEAQKEFLDKHPVKCRILLENLDNFWKLANKSKIVQYEFKLGLPLKIGSLTVHGKKPKIIMNAEIVNNLTSDPNFVKALVIHELYHIYLNNKISSVNDAFDSEEKDDKIFSKEFPRYHKILERQKTF